MLKKVCFLGTILSGIYIHQLDKNEIKEYEKWCPIKYIKKNVQKDKK